MQNMANPHRIIDDRIEKSVKRKTNLAQSALARLRQVNLRCKDWVSIKLGRRNCLGAPSDHPPSSLLGMGYICGPWVLPGRYNALTEIVPNSSSPYTLFDTVIYNSLLWENHNMG